MKKILTCVLLLISTQVFAGPRLYVFDCGVINMDSLEIFGLRGKRILCETVICSLLPGETRERSAAVGRRSSQDNC